jgi:hypothetical protein
MDDDNTSSNYWPPISHKTTICSNISTPNENGDVQQQKVSSASFPLTALPNNNFNKKLSKCVSIKVDDDDEENDEFEDEEKQNKKGLQLRLNVGGRRAQLSISKV